VLTLKTQLHSRFKTATRIAFLGVGSELRGDDAAGLLVAEHLEEILPASLGRGKEWKVFLGGTAPENFTGVIKGFNPSHVVIIDSADMRGKAGEVRIIDPQQLSGITFCTHQLPLNIMVDYMRESLQCEVTIIGIQPQSLAFGEGISQQVHDAVHGVAEAIKDALSERGLTPSLRKGLTKKK
jgi:hydrogenase 3 maturation protease